jgi:hypothetical protein
MRQASRAEGDPQAWHQAVYLANDPIDPAATCEAWLAKVEALAGRLGCDD